MTDEPEEPLTAATLGETLAELPPMPTTRSGINDLPPGGAGRLVKVSGDYFEWEPLSQQKWRALSAEKRVKLLVERGVAWLEVNGDVARAPVAFVDPAAMDEASERLFGETVTTLKEAICATHRLLHNNPATAQGALLALSATILLITGVAPAGAAVAATAQQLAHHAPVFAPHVTEFFVTAFAQRFCK